MQINISIYTRRNETFQLNDEVSHQNDLQIKPIFVVPTISEVQHTTKPLHW